MDDDSWRNMLKDWYFPPASTYVFQHWKEINVLLLSVLFLKFLSAFKAVMNVSRGTSGCTCRSHFVFCTLTWGEMSHSGEHWYYYWRRGGISSAVGMFAVAEPFYFLPWNGWYVTINIILHCAVALISYAKWNYSSVQENFVQCRERPDRS
jgi:hypothetical protein